MYTFLFSRPRSNVLLFASIIFFFYLLQHASADECSPCLPGHYSNADKTPNCTKSCSPGFCPDVSQCATCEPTTSNPYYNASSCSNCRLGQVSTWGAVNCTSCTPGFCSNYWGTMCILCEKGTYNPYYERAVSCIPCRKGYYNPSWGSSSQSACLPCPEGSYCPYDINPDFKNCPAGSYCPRQAVNPTKCQPLFESDTGSADCKPALSFYLIISASILLFCVIIVSFMAYFRAIKSSNYVESDVPTEVAASEKRYESQRLIPAPKDGPVYSGL